MQMKMCKEAKPAAHSNKNAALHQRSTMLIHLTRIIQNDNLILQQRAYQV